MVVELDGNGNVDKCEFFKIKWGRTPANDPRVGIRHLKGKVERVTCIAQLPHVPGLVERTG